MHTSTTYMGAVLAAKVFIFLSIQFWDIHSLVVLQSLVGKPEDFCSKAIFTGLVHQLVTGQ